VISVENHKKKFLTPCILRHAADGVPLGIRYRRTESKN